jgi:hypothetical protein
LQGDGLEDFEIEIMNKPKYNSLEIEDIQARKNYVFKKDGKVVEMWDTSINLDAPQLLWTFPTESSFPFGRKNSEEYYQYVFEKSLKAIDGVCFLGYVDDNFEPIEEEEEI